VYRTEVVGRFDAPPTRDCAPGRRLTTTSSRRPAMARSDSTRGEAVFSASPNRRRTAISPTRRARYGTSSRPRWINRLSVSRRYPHNTELVTQLREMAQLLRTVYSACGRLAYVIHQKSRRHDITRHCQPHRTAASAPLTRRRPDCASIGVPFHGVDHHGASCVRKPTPSNRGTCARAHDVLPHVYCDPE
jgi:hypothetical protein